MKYLKNSLFIISVLFLGLLVPFNILALNVSADYTVPIGEEWTYIEDSDGSYTRGIKVTSVPPFPSLPLATVYENYIPIGDNREIGKYVYDRETVDNFILENPTYDITIGGRLCICVDVQEEIGFRIIDISTGILLYAYSRFGEITFVYRIIKWSVSPPLISISTPYDDEVFGITAPDFEISITEVNLDKAWYTLEGGEQISFEGVNGKNFGTIDSFSWTSLDDGPVTITFYINDILGTGGFDDVKVIKDTINPVILIASPTNDDCFDGLIPNYNISIIEKNLENSWYTLNGGDPIPFIGDIGQNLGTIDSDAWVQLENGPVVITFYAGDSAGNIGSCEITVNKTVSDLGQGFSLIGFLLTPLGLTIMIGFTVGIIFITIGPIRLRSKRHLIR